MKTPIAKKETVERNWVVIDAADQVVGRLATRIATILRGKNKTNFTPHVDTGDFVIVVNADKVRLTGRKLEQKAYYRHSGHPSGLTETLAQKMLDEKPEQILYKAVRNMIPNPGFRTGKNTMRKLKIYTGPEHPHKAQQPVRVEVK